MRIIKLPVMIIVGLGFFSSLSAQLEYNVKNLGVIHPAATVNPMELDGDLFPAMIYKEAPKHTTSELAAVKNKVSELYPRKESTLLDSRSGVEAPVVDFGFAANPRQPSSPTDNSFAIGYDGVNVSVINSNIQFRSEEGAFIRNFSLELFSDGLGFGAGKFDPRTIFDTESNRFVMTWLAGNDSNSSTIIIAFSSSEDPTEPWFLYEIDGSPQGPGIWSDYPMISLTDSELILTMNLVRDFEAWQTGFHETLVYQMDKENAYIGESLNLNLIDGITFGGQPIRNIHPVKSADSELEDDLYLLSNRNFAIDNDTIFMMHLTGGLDNPEIEVEMLLSDVPYSVSPNGQQISGEPLATNDSRVLDAFRIGNHIQFVSNALDPDRGSSGVFHGTIEDVTNPDGVIGRILNHPDFDIGYPGIAWTGIDETETDAIVVAQHSSSTAFAGISSMYLDDQADASDWIIVKDGVGYVDLLGAEERWGDYIGCQRKFNEPGVVWLSSMIADAANRTTTWVAALSEFDRQQSSTEEPREALYGVTVSPNPVIDRATITMQIPRKDVLHLSLNDINGQQVHLFHNSRAKKVGELEFSFDMSTLASGVYIFRGSLGGDEIVSQKIVKP